MKEYIIRKSDIAENYRILCDRAGQKKVYCVIKGNAYGMGTVQFTAALYECGARHFACVDIPDAKAVREIAPDAEILLMTPVNDTVTAQSVSDLGLVAAVENVTGAGMLSEVAYGQKIKIQLKLDTGFGRYGLCEDGLDTVRKIAALEGTELDGAFTHLARSFVKKPDYSENQISLFFKMVDEIKKIGIELRTLHAQNSIGIFRFPDERFTAVRAGSALIGRVNATAGRTGLVPVGKLSVSVNSVRDLKKGAFVGYAGLYMAKHDIRACVLDVGYADGYCTGKREDSFRKLDVLREVYNSAKHFAFPPRLYARIDGKECPLIGRVGMTSASFDVTGTQVKPGDMATVDQNPIFLAQNISRRYV